MYIHRNLCKFKRKSSLAPGHCVGTYLLKVLGLQSTILPHQRYLPFLFIAIGLKSCSNELARCVRRGGSNGFDEGNQQNVDILYSHHIWGFLSSFFVKKAKLL